MNIEIQNKINELIFIKQELKKVINNFGGNLNELSLLSNYVTELTRITNT